MKRNYRSSRSDDFYKKLSNDLSSFPFSFIYNGNTYSGFPCDIFTVRERTKEEKESKVCETVKLSLSSSLNIEILLTHYYSHGFTEWTVWFENPSDENSGIIEKPESTLVFEGALPALKGILGDHVNQYSPYAIDLQNNTVKFSSDSGRATHINFPYFNLEYADGGALLAIGWAGTWSAGFSSDSSTTTYTASSVNGLKTYLKPGERIRTALFVVGHYTVRNEHYATNLWRDWFVNHNLPAMDKSGAPLTPFSTCDLAHDTGLPNSDGSISENFTTWKPSLEKMIAEDVKVDFRWFDAGWYIAPDQTSAQSYVKGHDWWDTVGTWELDPIKWPGKTFLESTEFARANGMKTLVWFEPERVTDPENLAKYYGYNEKWAIRVEGETTISNNIGDPDCLKWTTDRICKMLRDNKVEMYREDNNCNPAPLWKHLDSVEGEGRNGITESKFIIGHYKMWDDIIACTLSYGGCGFVDSCASGGGRNDLESMRRGIPLLRSDSDRTTTSLRLSMTSSFNKWIPFCGASTKEKTSELAPTGVRDKYVWRASYLACLNASSQFVCDPDQDFDLVRFGMREWKKVSPYLLKEFYTLTPWHREIDRSSFTALCYFDPETEEGVILAFRQEACVQSSLTLTLPFANASDRFIIKDEDTGNECEVEGSFTLSFDHPRSAKLLMIKKVQ